MFTGIISDIGRVLSAEQGGDLRLRIACSYDPDSIELGASIACSGVCLTVVDKGPEGGCWFAVDVSAETVSCSASELWREGARLNLERALRVGDELGGHIVTGHVDAVGTLVELVPDGDSLRMLIEAPSSIAPALAAKGSVALDGVSLTVNRVEDLPQGVRFTINLIPHSASHTTLGAAQPGRDFNIEIDVLARYLHRMLAARQPATADYPPRIRD